MFRIPGLGLCLLCPHLWTLPHYFPYFPPPFLVVSVFLIFVLSDGSLLPAESLSVTGKPTATTPFLPSNSNADIVNTITIAPHSTPTEISSSGTINSNSEAKVNFSSNYVSKYSPNADIFSDA
ncbi:hypothetical protein B0H14DRAFT_3438942 [Mycena olivaceomarginata]|nr:hypothetical protein B0H14DRAFT_3438942 [Mycena olivaceomarginata]